MKLIVSTPSSVRQLSGTPFHLAQALMSQHSAGVDVVPLSLRPHSEFKISRLKYLLRERSLEARRGFSLSSEYYSAAYERGSTGVVFEPDDVFLSFHQIAPRQMIRRSLAGQCRVAAYVDLSLSEYLRTYSVTHGIPPRTRDRLQIEERACMAAYHRVFVFDEASRQAMMAEFALDGSRVVVLGRGVNIDAARLDAIRAARRARTPDGTIRLLFVGADAKRKGLDEIVGGIDDLPTDLRARVRLDVVGPDRAEVAERPFITAHGFLDPQADEKTLTELSVRADVGVLLSDAEGIPGAVLEFLSCGVPAIVTALPRIRDFLGGHAVMLVDPAQRRIEFGTALRALLDDPGELKALTARAEARQESFGWKPVASRLIDSLASRPG